MANNFNMNTNKQTFFDEFSQTTISGGFANDTSTFLHDGVPNTTPSSTTFIVTFNNSDNNGGSATYTAQPYEKIGHAIDEKKLNITKFLPMYYYNGNRVDTYTILPIKSDIDIDVVWISQS